MVCVWGGWVCWWPAAVVPAAGCRCLQQRLPEPAYVPDCLAVLLGCTAWPFCVLLPCDWVVKHIVWVQEGDVWLRVHDKSASQVSRCCGEGTSTMPAALCVPLLVAT